LQGFVLVVVAAVFDVTAVNNVTYERQAKPYRSWNMQAVDQI